MLVLKKKKLVLKKTTANGAPTPTQAIAEVPSLTRVIGPQPGPQTAFLSTPADIAIYGGAAGGGKTVGLILEGVRHSAVPGFNAVLFRRTHPQLIREGGPWPTSMEFYPLLGAKPYSTNKVWKFPSGAVIQMAHLQHEKDKISWQGSAICLILWDELTHFSESQFFYMLSRNRSTCGVAPYVRASCNPDAGSWVAKFIEWWIDESTGFPIPERSGVIRWFIRRENTLIWADSKSDLLAQCSPGEIPKSVTFIPAKLTDNKILTSKDPGYEANLHALSRFERLQLLDGNWKVRPTCGMVFRREWYEIVDAVPGTGKIVRYWDRAASAPAPGTNPDWTVGIKMLRHGNTFYVLDVVRLQNTPRVVEEAIKNTAAQDGHECEVWLEEDPGQAGKADISYLISALCGYHVRANRVTLDKVTRALPASSQSEAGNIKFLRGRWNEPLLLELENFGDPDQVEDAVQKDIIKKTKKDQVDAFSGAFNVLQSRPTPRIS